MEFSVSAALLKELLTWRAIIDILLISTGMYGLYRTLLGLGTWNIVTGILIAILFFLIANLLSLRGIEWVFNNISQVAVIALIIIFQPEIRKLLERAASLRRLKLGKYNDTLSHVLSEAVFTMADKRQGALIVLPGKDPIVPVAQQGDFVPLRSTSTVALLIDPHVEEEVYDTFNGN